MTVDPTGLEGGAVPPSSTTAGGRQLLTFTLGTDDFAVDILRVQEIRGYSAITAVPNAPGYLRGVLNLRGAVVPIVDLRSRLGLPPTEYNKFTVIIVVKVRSRIVGLIVDAVSDVMDVAALQIEPPPEVGGEVANSCVAGMAKAGDRLILLLDVDTVASGSEGAKP